MPVISNIDSVYRKDKNYYPKVCLEKLINYFFWRRSRNFGFLSFGNLSWNINFFLEKMQDLFELVAGKFQFPKYKNFFQSRFLYFGKSLGLESTISQNMRNLWFFLFFKLGKFHFTKYKKNVFLRKYDIFLV